MRAPAEVRSEPVIVLPKIKAFEALEPDEAFEHALAEPPAGDQAPHDFARGWDALAARLDTCGQLEERGYARRHEPPEKLPVEAELTAILKEQGRITAVVIYPDEKRYQLIEAPDFRKFHHELDRQEERLESTVRRVSLEDRCFQRLPVPVTVHDGCIQVDKAISLEQARAVERTLHELESQRREKNSSYEMDGP